MRSASQPPRIRPSQPSVNAFLTFESNAESAQLHRFDAGTPASTWLTCWPQPAQVGRPHLEHVILRHTVTYPRCRGDPGSADPPGHRRAPVRRVDHNHSRWAC